jgi:GrpB-like predicted nucleotidyltransferase (UPF0157 family)
VSDLPKQRLASGDEPRVAEPRSVPEDIHASLNEEQIRAATVGKLTPFDACIVLADYHPDWPELFLREAYKVHAALTDRALRIEHVGSTAVPGLIAKPIIDIVLVVTDSSDEAAYVSDLEAAGYVLHIREPNWHEHRMFKGRDPDVNLHVFSPSCREIERMLRFREWLRGNASDRDLYAHTKRELAQRQWTFRQNYADAKTPVIEGIMARANAAGPAL